MFNTDELWLCVDLSSQAGSLSLHRFQKSRPACLAEVELEDGGRHSESLLPGLQDLLAETGVAFIEIDRLVTSSGPGSFTGLRIAFAALKAFAQASGKPLEIIDGHEARVLHYLASVPTLPQQVRAVTSITRDSFLVTEYAVRSREKVERVAENLVNAAPSTDGAFAVETLKASHLAAALPHATSRQTLTDWNAVAAASPRYFGGRWEKAR